MPSYLSVILFALTNYRTDGIKPPIRSWQTSLPPPKEKDCHGRMSPTISAPQKKTQSSVAICCPMLAHTCQPLWAAVYTYGRLVIQIHMFPATSCYTSFPVPTSPYTYILCRSLFNLQVESPAVVGRCCKALKGMKRQYCVFWDEGVVNISKTPQILSISGFSAWENNEQENKTFLKVH